MMNNSNNCNERYKGKPKTKTKWRQTRVSLTGSGTGTEMSEPTKQKSRAPRDKGCVGRLVGCCCPKDSIVTTIESRGAANSSETARWPPPPPVVGPQIEINLAEVIIRSDKYGGNNEPKTTEHNRVNIRSHCGYPEENNNKNGGGNKPSSQYLPSSSAAIDSNKSLDDVRDNFITLISHNKLQYFMLGASIYTVMIIGNILNNYILSTNHDIDTPSSSPSTTTTNTTHHNLILYLETAQQQTKQSPPAHNHSNHHSIYPKNQPLVPLASWLIFCLYLVLLIGLTVTLIMATLEFSTNKAEGMSSNNQQRRTTQIAGLLIIIILLYLPSIVNISISFGCCFGNQLNLTDIDRHHGFLIMVNKEAHHQVAKNNNYNSGQSHQYRYWPSGSIMVPIYLLPVLIEGSRLDRKVARSFILLPAILLAILQLWFQHFPLLSLKFIDLAQAKFSSDLALIQITCVMLASLFGLQVRRALVKLVTRTTFIGAIQLIEAKDSLEHERQQQETLLLSVLPAYVAEQVKRNMLKKTTSASGCGTLSTAGGQDFQDVGTSPVAAAAAVACVVPTIVAPHLPATNSWKSRSFAASHAGSFQSIDSAVSTHILPNNESIQRASATTHHPTDRQPHAATSGSLREPIQQGNSFQLPLNKASSNLAAISETLAASDNHNKKSAVVANQSMPQHSINGQSVSLGPTTVPAAPSTAGQVRRGFNELYIRTYNNVSLLYGDIVGFTRLCTQLSSSQLVRVLNDLFSHFDHLAERHRIMRIKILGDCYYGVSGIPEFAVMGAKSRASRNDNHAINCVKMGLDMIHYIRCLNIERATTCSGGCSENFELPTTAAAPPTIHPGRSCSPMPSFELNMRIGIHTGHIHSGVIGLKKWQFDVWSNDVSIAMHCESSGIAGRVQVTQATVQQLNGAFIYENGHGSERDSFLASNDIQTYLIKDSLFPQTGSLVTTQAAKTTAAGASAAEGCSEAHMIHSTSHLEWPIVAGQQEGAAGQDRARKLEGGSGRGSGRGKQMIDSGERSHQMDEFNIRAATIGTIKQTLLAGDTCNANGLNSYGLALSHHDIRPLTLHYHDQSIGKLYATRPTERPLQELAVILFLVPLIYIINHQQPPGHELHESSRWLIILISICASILLTIDGLRQCFRSNLKSSQGPVPTTDLNDEPLDSLEPHQVIKGRESISKRPSLWKLCSYFVSEVACKLSPSSMPQFQIDRLLAIMITRLRLKTLATLLVSGCVIVFEVQQIIKNENIYGELDHHDRCGKSATVDDSREFNKWLQGEKYQLTVILLMFLLNSTLNLVSYRTRSILISIMLSLHLIKIFALLPLDHGCDQIDDNKSNNNEIQPGDNKNFKGYQEFIDASSEAILVALMLWSLAFARQIEYTNKTNFLWRNRLNVDHEELEYISGINKVLLENILPSHVVQHYLTHPNEQPKNQLMPNLSAYMRMSFSNMRNLNNGLYNEQHDGVAVMFASIPHFYEFYDESDISKQGLGCIALLNEIICDFDKLLLKNKFSRIEKIKTIGSTYMAAAGLRPCSLSGARNSTASQCSVSSSIPPNSSAPNKRACAISSNRYDLPSLKPNAVASGGCSDQLMADDRRLVMSQQKLNLICMIKFATSLMTALNGINKQSFQVFKLRVGVNTGPVIAGVIGALRPFYDIWGDCVNIASRMESLGEVGRIQVEEKTAKLLLESLCPDTYSIVRRGPIDVKGKGGMVTYFVDRIEGPTSGDRTQ